MTSRQLLPAAHGELGYFVRKLNGNDMAGYLGPLGKAIYLADERLSKISTQITHMDGQDLCQHNSHNVMSYAGRARFAYFWSLDEYLYDVASNISDVNIGDEDLQKD